MGGGAGLKTGLCISGKLGGWDLLFRGFLGHTGELALC